METRVSTRGQIVLPRPLRLKLAIHAGDPLDVDVEAGRIVLTPRTKRKFKTRIVKNSITGLPMLTAGPNAPILTSEQVAEILADFP